MTDFDQRWQQAVESARRTPPAAASGALPPGYATRLLARWEGTQVSPLMDWLLTQGLRAVVTAGVVFIGSAGLVAWQADVNPFSIGWLELPLSPEILLP